MRTSVAGMSPPEEEVWYLLRSSVNELAVESYPGCVLALP